MTDKKKRCDAELYLEKYFNLPNEWTEKDRLPDNVDIGIIVDLLVGFKDELLKQEQQ